MYRYNVQPVGAKGLECRSHFSLQHGDISRDSCVVIGSHKRGPGIEAHACVDRGAHFFYIEIIAPYSDFVHGAILLPGMANDFRNPVSVKPALLRRCVSSGFARFCLSYQIERWLDLICQIDSFAMSMNVHKKDSRIFPEEVIVQRSHLQPVLKQG